MLKKVIWCLFILPLISASAFSNSPFPGYYITNAGDTVRCSVDFNDWSRNPKTVRIMINSGSKEFGPADIGGFGVDGYADYISASVTYHLAPAAGYPSEYTDSMVRVSCFLKTLVPGRYPLYGLFTSEKNYFFYNYPGGSLSELIYRVKMTEGRIEEDASYRQQAFNLFESEGITSRYIKRLDRARYNTEDLTGLFSILNGDRNVSEKKTNLSTSFQTQIFVGGIHNIFPTRFDGDYLKQTKAGPYTTLSGGINLLMSPSGHFKALKLGMGVGYNKYNISIDESWSTNSSYYGIQYTTKYHEIIKGQNTELLWNANIMWVVNPLGKIQAYLKAGGTYHLSLKSKRDISNSYYTVTTETRDGNSTETSNQNSNVLIQPKGDFLSFMGAAGITYGRHGFECSYWPPVNVVGQTNPRIQNAFKVGMIGVYYYFSLTGVKKEVR